MAYIGYQKLQFNEGEDIVIVSCSVENSYHLFGFKLKTLKENYYLENIEVQAIEATTVIPNFTPIAPGNRHYTLTDWESMGMDLNSIKEEKATNNNQFEFMDPEEEISIYSPGVVPILPQIYVGIKDFNPEDRERCLEE